MLSDLMIDFLSKLRAEDLQRLMEVLEDDSDVFNTDAAMDGIKICIATRKVMEESHQSPRNE